MGHRASTSAFGNNTAPTVAVPTVVAGDHLILVLSWGTTANPTVTSPAGYTRLMADVVDDTATPPLTTRVLTKVAGSSESAPIFGTGGVQLKWAAVLAAYSGLTTSAAQVLTTIDGAATNNHALPGVASAAATDTLIDINTERSTTNASWTPAASETARQTVLGSGSSAVSMLFADRTGQTSYSGARTAASSTSSIGTGISLVFPSSSSVVAPSAPTGAVATSGDGQASVAFTPGNNGGDPSVTYVATSTPGGKTGTSNGSPIVVAGLTNGTSYTFTVHATNSAGTSAESSASAAVTPAGVPVTFVNYLILDAPGGVTPPPPTVPRVGVAIAGPNPVTTETGQEAWNRASVVGVQLARPYNPGLPATWQQGADPALIGPTDYVTSVKPDINGTISGSLDAAISAWANSLPSNVKYVIAQHEPENKTKYIDPLKFGPFSQRFYNLVKAKKPAVKVGICFMTYTSNFRASGPIPSDANGGTFVTQHVIGHNEWMQNCFDVGFVPDFVAWDGYPGGTRHAHFEFEPPRLLADALWPGIEQNTMEFGWPPSATRASLLADAYAYFTSVGFTVVDYFHAYGRQASIDYTLTDAELQVFGGLGGSF